MKKMMKPELLLAAAMLMILAGCGAVETSETETAGTSAVESMSSGEITPSESEDTDDEIDWDHTVLVDDWYGEGLIGLTDISGQTGETPAFTEGTALRDTYVYWAPSEQMYERGILYQGKKIEVLQSLWGETVNEDGTAEVTENYWYLIKTGADEYGYVHAEDIADAAQTDVEETGPYRLKAGAVYCYNTAFEDVEVNGDQPLGRLTIAEENTEEGWWKLEGTGGFSCFINDLNSIEFCPGLGPARNLRAE